MFYLIFLSSQLWWGLAKVAGGPAYREWPYFDLIEFWKCFCNLDKGSNDILRDKGRHDQKKDTSISRVTSIIVIIFISDKLFSKNE